MGGGGWKAAGQWYGAGARGARGGGAPASLTTRVSEALSSLQLAAKVEPAGWGWNQRRSEISAMLSSPSAASRPARSVGVEKRSVSTSPALNSSSPSSGSWAAAEARLTSEGRR